MKRGTNMLDDVAEVDKDKKVTADYNLRVLATEAGLESNFNPDAATTTKQVYI